MTYIQSIETLLVAFSIAMLAMAFSRRVTWQNRKFFLKLSACMSYPAIAMLIIV